jgi:hypothetical protein
LGKARVAAAELWSASIPVQYDEAWKVRQPGESNEMNSTSSSYWQEQQLMDAMVRGLKHKAKLDGSSESDSDGTVSPTSSSGGASSEASDDRVRNWLDVRTPSLHRTLRASARTRQLHLALRRACLGPLSWFPGPSARSPCLPDTTTSPTRDAQQQLGEDAADEYTRWKEEKRISFSKNLRVKYGLP